MHEVKILYIFSQAKKHHIIPLKNPNHRSVLKFQNYPNELQNCKIKTIIAVKLQSYNKNVFFITKKFKL